MSALLAAEAVAGLDHVLIDVLVADLGLLVLDAHLVEGLVEAEVRHDGGDDLVVEELAALLHVQAVDVQRVVAGDDIALLVHTEAAVGVAVVGKADVQALVHHELLQMLDMRRAAVGVDVVAVRLRVHDIGPGAERVEHGLRDLPGGAVGHIQAHLHVLEAVLAHGNQVPDVAVAAGHIVHGAADLLPLGNGDLDLAVDVLLDLEDGLLVHLLAAAAQELDAVVVVGVVGGGDHDAAVEVVHAGDPGHGGGGGHVHDIGVRAGGHEARAQRVLEHVGGAAGVLADDDPGLLAQTRAVVPAEEAADLDGVLIAQALVRLAAKAVRAEVFAHAYSLSFRSMSRKYL